MGRVVDEIGIHKIDYGQKGDGKFFREFQNYLMALKKKGFYYRCPQKITQKKYGK